MISECSIFHLPLFERSIVSATTSTLHRTLDTFLATAQIVGYWISGNLTDCKRHRCIPNERRTIVWWFRLLCDSYRSVDHCGVRSSHVWIIWATYSFQFQCEPQLVLLIQLRQKGAVAFADTWPRWWRRWFCNGHWCAWSRSWPWPRTWRWSCDGRCGRSPGLFLHYGEAIVQRQHSRSIQMDLLHRRHFDLSLCFNLSSWEWCLIRFFALRNTWVLFGAVRVSCKRFVVCFYSASLHSNICWWCRFDAAVSRFWYNRLFVLRRNYRNYTKNTLNVIVYYLEGWRKTRNCEMSGLMRKKHGVFACDEFFSHCNEFFFYYIELWFVQLITWIW